MDVLRPGIGEIVGGSQREERLDVLADSMLQGDLLAIDTFGVDQLVANIAITLRDADARPVTVAAGTFEQAMVYEIMLFRPVVGGPDFVIEVTLGAGILNMSMPGASMELLGPWA